MPDLIEAWNWLSEGWWHLAVHITWQSSLLALLVLGLLVILRRWPAPLRHALLLVVLIKFLVPPFFTAPTGVFSQLCVANQTVASPADATQAGAPQTGDAIATPANAALGSSMPASLAPVAAGAVVGDDPLGAGARSDRMTASGLAAGPASVAEQAPTWMAWLAAVWALGACIAGLRTFASARRLAGLRRRGTTAPAAVRAQFSQLLRELGIRRAPLLVVTDEPVGPAAFGVLRATVLLPRAILRMSASELRLVLAHELVHHRRLDLAVSWLQVAVGILWWFNPIVRLLDRSVREVREECCDDLLLAHGVADSETYCQSLLSAACLLGVTNNVSLSAAYNEHPMGRRFRRIMDRTRTQRARLGLAGYGAVATMVCVALPGLGRAGDDRAAMDLQDPVGQVEVEGRVVDASGKPVAGARVFLGSDAQGTAARTASGDDGRFIFSCPAPVDGKPLAVAATAATHGLQWGTVTDGEALTLQLPRDLAIRGQLLDQEGQPLAGAKLSVLLVYASEQESLEPMMAKIASGDAIEQFPMWNALDRRFDGPGFPDDIETDAQGRFEVAGFGAERAIVFVVRAKDATTAAFTVLTRELETFTYPKGGAKSIMGARTFYGAQFVYIAPASRTVRGRAIDEQGQPVAGAQVRVEIPSGTDASGSRMSGVDNFEGEAESTINPTYLRTSTDADGRFDLPGLPRTKFSTMIVDGRAIGYSYDSVRIPNDKDSESIDLEFVLQRACRLHGKVIDDAGKPVVGARIQYVEPMRSAGFRSGDPDGEVSMKQGCKTQADGTFELVVPAGKARVNVYAGAAYEPVSVPRGPMMGFMGGGPLSAFAELDTQPGDVVEANMTVRAANTARVHIVGPDGQPLAGCRVVGKDPQDMWTKQGIEGHEIVLRGFDAKRPRNVAVYHEAQSLIGMLDVDVVQGEQPWILKTQPAASIVGRLVDVDGAPRAGIRIYVTSDLRNNPSLGFVTAQLEQICGTRQTDAEGRFELKALMPGATYSILTLDDDMDKRRRLMQGVKVESGETKDVGACVGQLIY